MREIRIKFPSPEDLIRSDFGRHLLRAHKEILLAFASIPHMYIKKIEELEKKIEKE